MTDDQFVYKTIQLKAPVDKVWEALTNPEITKKYFYGCEAISDWNVGSPVNYHVDYNGTDMIVVSGIILSNEPHKLLECTCYAPEHKDNPAEHTTASYRFEANDSTTTLSVSQGPFADDEKKGHTSDAWDVVLEGLRVVVEEAQ